MPRICHQATVINLLLHCLVGYVGDMSLTCHKISFLSVNFQKNVSVSNTHHWRTCLCGVYQRRTQRKNVIFVWIFELFIARQAHCTNKKEKCMLGSTYLLTGSLTLIRHVTNMSMTCQKISVLSVFEPTQHKATIPTKLHRHDGLKVMRELVVCFILTDF